MTYKEAEKIDPNTMSPHAFALLMVTNQDLKLFTIENIDKYAGSFVKALGNCLSLADNENVYRLVSEFYDYFCKYVPFNWKTVSCSEKPNK